MEKCNCGKEGRYPTADLTKTSCNKYKTCLSYEELNAELEKYEKWYHEVLEAANDLRTFRESTTYYKAAEEIILKHK